MASKPLIDTLDETFVELGKTIDLTNKQFNLWKVLGYKGNGNWLCECSCENNTRKIVPRHSLVNGSSKSCGCLQREYAVQHIKEVAASRTEDITGREFGDFVALKYAGKGNWLCKCKICGNEREFKKRDTLLNKKCTKHNHPSSFIDLKEKHINNWEVLEYVGDKKWKCQCKCGNIRIVKAQRLISGDSKSCGCLKQVEFLKSYGYNDETVQTLLNKELELLQFIQEIHNGEIIQGDRTVLNGTELDIYLPDKQLAFEFSDINVKDKMYHQDKTLKCFKKNIRLIHIFEYEWKNNKENIKNFITDLLNDNKQVIYARNTVVKEISKSKKKEFLEKYHLQGNDNSAIYFGCYLDNTLLGIMTFGKPRFDTKYEYEIFRMCWMTNIIVIGGSNKIFKAFLNKYKPNNVITYTDISKYTGMSYLKLGFKLDSITQPNYVWVSGDMNYMLSRYQTQKQKLLANNLQQYGETEAEIMYNLKYLRVYNSGNAKYVYDRQGV